MDNIRRFFKYTNTIKKNCNKYSKLLLDMKIYYQQDFYYLYYNINKKFSYHKYFCIFKNYCKLILKFINICHFSKFL